MITIMIRDNFDGSYSVHFRSNSPWKFGRAVEELKELIPARHRTFEPSSKLWIINSRIHLDRWLSKLETWGEVEVEGRTARQYQAPPQSPPKRTSRDEAFATLYLLPTAPPELVKMAYKTLAMIYHPDRGGDLERMKAVNTAFDTLNAA